MTVHELPKTREQSLRHCRIANLVNAFFLIESEDEVQEALESVPEANLKTLGRLVARILAAEPVE